MTALLEGLLLVAVVFAVGVLPGRLLVAMCIEARNYPKRWRVLRIILGLDSV